jgi:hypothetical protein
MSGKKAHHVIRNPDGGWDIKKGGSSRSSGHFPTQKDAIGAAREISTNQGSELYIHGRDGRVHQKGSARECPPSRLEDDLS